MSLIRALASGIALLLLPHHFTIETLKAILEKI